MCVNFLIVQTSSRILKSLRWKLRNSHYEGGARLDRFIVPLRANKNHLELSGLKEKCDFLMANRGHTETAFDSLLFFSQMVIRQHRYWAISLEIEMTKDGIAIIIESPTVHSLNALETRFYNLDVSILLLSRENNAKRCAWIILRFCRLKRKESMHQRHLILTTCPEKLLENNSNVLVNVSHVQSFIKVLQK